MPDSRTQTTAATGQLWTAQETADYLRIPKATLYQWHYLGIGPSTAVCNC
jgi:hypothetical protein